MAKYLVSGATGKQGGAVVNALLSSDQISPSQVVVLVRNPASPAAEALKKKGVTLAKGSLTDSDSLVKAMEGVTGAFLMTFPLGKEGAKAEATQGKTFIDAAKKVGVQHIVFTSVEGADRMTGIPHFDTKFQVEEYLRASGISHSIIRPVAFYENLPPQGGFQATMTLGIFEAALKGKKLQMVSTKDIVQALLDPAKYQGRAIPLAGDSLTVAEMQQAYQKANNRSQSKFPVPGFAVSFLPKDFSLMLKWFHDHGYEADITALRAEHPGLLTFEQYLRGDQ